MPPFSLAPGLVGIKTPINYTTYIVAELYRVGSRLPPIKEENLSVFTNALMDHSQEMGWDNHQESILAIQLVEMDKRFT